MDMEKCIEITGLYLLDTSKMEWQMESDILLNQMALITKDIWLKTKLMMQRATFGLLY